MKLKHGLHLAYCTNVHRGETWAQTFEMLEKHTLVVRQRIASGQPYAIGLRLGERAAVEIAQPAVLAAFRGWLDQHDCYVFTINGFPYGNFHGQRVKEQVYAPDWSTSERVIYTKLLFDLMAELVPAGVGGSISTVPGSFREWMANDADRRAAIFANVTEVGRYVAELSDHTQKDLHLGLEPEPCCYFETTPETVGFFNEWRTSDASVESDELMQRIGVNYDCCHLGVEFETAGESLDALTAAGIRLSKIHLSSALRVKPDEAGRAALQDYIEPTYLHQVVVGDPATGIVRRRFVDLPDALAYDSPANANDEWRVHFHLPLHAAPGAPFADTRDHLLGTLDWMQANPTACQHAEMETYTWEVLPKALRIGIEDQLVCEYEWTLEALSSRGLA